MRRVALALVLCCVCATQGERTYGETYSELDEEPAGPPGAPGTTAYDLALQKAAKGEADGEVLEEIRKGYEEVKSRYYMRKTNLAAVLLDVANRQAKIEDWTAMYKEAQTLSRQLLAVFPTDTDAQANLRAATNSLKMRTQQAGGQAAEDGDVSQARRLLSDDDDEEDDDADQEGDSDAPAGGKPPGGWNTASGDQRAAMTYAEAMQRAQQGKADEEVLAIFRNELEKAKDTGNAETIKTHKANLAALIIDIAKNEAEPRVWRPMYAESIELSEQVLEFFPDDATAKANKQAAEAWLAHRTSKLEKMEEAEFLSLMEERPGPATHGGAPAPPSDGLTEEERARRMLLDDDDEDDDGKEEL